LGLRATTDDLLNRMDPAEIPNALALAACYLGIFLFAEAAFVLMAIREYLQDVMHLDEMELLRGVPASAVATAGFQLSNPPELRPLTGIEAGPATNIPDIDC